MPGSFDKTEAETGNGPQTSMSETPYMVKSIQANEASPLGNFLAAIFSWLTLAGYVVFPGSFTSLKASQTLAGSDGGKLVQDTVKNLPLLAIAGLCFGIGTIGTSWLWWIWRENAVWLVAHLFLTPPLLVGLITTIVNIYTAQGGHWSTTAKVTVVMIGVCTGNMSVLYLVYNHWILAKIKTPRDKELAKQGHL